MEVSNPFLGWGARDDLTLFVGRDDPCRQVWAWLRSGENATIVGEQSTGKTSFLRLIRAQAAAQLPGAVRAIWLSADDIRTRERAEATLVKRLQGGPARADLEELILDQQLILLLDNLDALDPDKPGWRVRQWLRSLSENPSTRIQLVATSSQPLRERFPERKEREFGGSSFHGIMSRAITLPPFSRAEAAELIRRVLARSPAGGCAPADFAPLLDGSLVPGVLWRECYTHYEALRRGAAGAPPPQPTSPPIVGDARLRLSGPQEAALQQALLQAFPQLAALEQMVRFQLEENLADIAIGDSLAAITFRLIGWARAQQRLETLVRGALAANPGSIALRTFAGEMGLLDREPPPY
ncbi:MAG TPA: effector-associated domain EAD1-containing protein [Chloroflexia bacterium]|nr:effector-associated domain EAD1-containing protein [Chloroflexia bacterium]